MIAERIAVVNKKGGVGKTTTTVNLGAALAELDKRVLLIDTDSQGAVAASFGIDIEEAPTLLDALHGKDLREVIIGNVNRKVDQGGTRKVDHPVS